MRDGRAASTAYTVRVAVPGGALCLLATGLALLAPGAQAGIIQTISRTVTLPADGTEVTLTLSGADDLLIRQISFDNTPTLEAGLCAPSLPDPIISCQWSRFQITALRVNGRFWRTTDTPLQVAGADQIAHYQLFGLSHFNEDSNSRPHFHAALPLPKTQPFAITLRRLFFSSPPPNDVRVRVTFAVTKTKELALAESTGPVAFP